MKKAIMFLKNVLRLCFTSTDNKHQISTKYVYQAKGLVIFGSPGSGYKIYSEYKDEMESLKINKPVPELPPTVMHSRKEW